MKNAMKFREKLQRGQVCFGVGITFYDPTVTDALCPLFDFVWIDMEHNALSLETVQAHIMATKGSDTTPLVSVRAFCSETTRGSVPRASPPAAVTILVTLKTRKKPAVIHAVPSHDVPITAACVIDSPAGLGTAL